MNSCFQGARVRLRAIVPSDWELYHRNDADTDSQRLVDQIFFPRSEQGAREWAERTATQPRKDDSVFLAIETLDGELVGAISTNSCEPRHGTFKYGVGIFRSHWRKGYGSEAILLLLRYYFQELRYQKASTVVYDFNEPSLRLHERLGFQVEGRLRRMRFTQGRYHDEIAFGMTAEEFAERYGHQA